MPTRGFVTIATGNEKYYKLAENLLKSYRKYATDDVPFAIICDRENDLVKEFDQVIIIKDATFSYMDKLLLYRYAPYDETIFIDADCLVFSDLSGLWEDFSDADDVSCYGCVHPLDSQSAWFTYEGCGVYRKDIKYLIDLHGGIYYLRKSERCRSVFEKAIELAGEYKRYSFRNFEEPADEPVVAMSLAIHGSVPCDKKMRILFVPSYWGKVRVNSKGQVFCCGKRQDVEIIHFSTTNTSRFSYNYLLDCMNGTTQEGIKGKLHFLHSKLAYAPKEIYVSLRHYGGVVLRKVVSEKMVKRIKEIISR